MYRRDQATSLVDSMNVRSSIFCDFLGSVLSFGITLLLFWLRSFGHSGSRGGIRTTTGGLGISSVVLSTRSCCSIANYTDSLI